MLYHSIKSFRGVETKEESSDQDRTVARDCTGLIPVPQGALSNGPKWSLLWGINDLPARMATLLAAANQTKAHIVRLARGSHVMLICWSIPQSRALGLFNVGSEEVADFASTSGITLTCLPAPAFTVSSPYTNKDSLASWFISRIGASWILGNGIDQNLIYQDGVLSVFGPGTAPEDINDRFRVRIPPCTSFRLNERRNLFAAGNAAQPMRVWITDTPSEIYQFPTGVNSLDRSFIDIHSASGATRITALSLFDSYVTVHTDSSPVNIYGVNNTSDGWACQQAASGASSSAINPSCVGDPIGDASFFLGADLEIYTDQAVRRSQWEKNGARDQEIVTAQAAQVWNRDMSKADMSWGFHVLYDANTRLFWVFGRTTLGPVMLWAYYERTRTIVGPIHYPAAEVSAFIGGSTAAIISQAGEMLCADLNIVETEAVDVEAPGTALGASYTAVNSEPTPIAGIPVVGLTADRRGCIEKVGGVVIGSADPFNRVGVVSQGNFTITEWFNNATLASWESPWQAMAESARFKNLLEVELTFDRDSRAYVGVCVENERGQRRWKWVGVTHGKSKPVRAALNLFGVRFRVRICLVVFNNARMILRDMRLGFNPAGND